MTTKEQKINYDLLVQNAMRHCIRDLLDHISKNGLPGKHYFYIDFLTHFPGVKLSEDLKSAYPEDMMISIQYDYFDLDITKDSFSVTLVFDEDEERITVPFAAITRFTDPSVEFTIEFETAYETYQVDEAQHLLEELEGAPDLSTKEKIDNIISFDTFKRK